MKMSRFFILIGACTLLSTFALQTVESIHRPCWSNPFIPILRADPWAGDPDMPGIGRELPADEGSLSNKTSSYEVSSLTQAPSAPSLRSTLWLRLRALRFMASALGRPW